MDRTRGFRVFLFVMAIGAIVLSVIELVAIPSWGPVFPGLGGLVLLVAALAFPIGRDDPASRCRQAMLEQVRQMWIEGVLESPLRRALSPAFRVRLEYAPAVTQPPADGEGPAGEDAPLDILSAYDRAEGMLLILGEPGAGKTTLLLELANALLARARDDPAYRIPVVFALSSWSEGRKPLNLWMVDELIWQYKAPRGVAEEWVKRGRLVPLLDELDELPAQDHSRCIAAINRHLRAFPGKPLVVCSQGAVLEPFRKKPALRGAVRLLPLSRADVDLALGQEGARAALRDALQADETLYERLDTPLRLSVAARACAGGCAPGVLAGGSAEGQDERLWEAYLEAARLPGDGGRRQLAWLAEQMRARRLSLFHLEHLSLSWLSRRAHQAAALWTPAVALGVIAGPTVGLTVAIFFNRVAGWIAGTLVTLLVALVGAGHARSAAPPLTNHPLFDGIAAPASWRRAGRAAFALAGGLGLGLISRSYCAWASDTDARLTFATFLMTTNAMAFGFVVDSWLPRAAPHRQIRRAAERAGLWALMLGPALALYVSFSLAQNGDRPPAGALFWGLLFGLLWALTTTFETGGLACLRHLLLRALLAREGRLPWRLATCLDDAAARGLLQRVGASYRFAHAGLREWLAKREA